MSTTFFEAIAAFATLIAVYQISRGKISGWLYSIVGSMFYGVLYFHKHMPATGVLQIIYTVQAIFGLKAWIDAKQKTTVEFSCRKMNYDKLMEWIIIFVFIFGGNYLVDQFFTTTNLENVDYADYSLAISSIGALTLTTYRYIQSWYIWICINVGYIILCSHLHMWPSVILNIILIFISINGLLQWRKSLVMA